MITASKDTIFLIISLFPLLAVNVWHSLLLFHYRAERVHRSISQHATDTANTLLIHRIVHCTASIMLMFFSIFYLTPHHYLLASSLLISAAVFDVMEVMSLSKKSANKIMALKNPHAITAWLMALCYLSYMVVVVPLSGLSIIFVYIVFSCLALLLATCAQYKMKNFWLVQHIYFCLVALQIFIAHVAFLV